MKHKLLSIGAVALALMAIQAKAAAPEMNAEQIKKMLATQVDGIVKLPATSMTLIEANGKSFLVSDNGRIVVTGKMYDMWNGVELTSVADVNKYAYKIDVSKLGLKLDDLGAITIGNGKKEVIAFIDPNSAPSHKFVQTAARLNQYTLKLIMIPGPEKESQEKVKKASCVAEKALVAKALIDNAWDKLLADVKECELLPLQKAIITSRIFGVNSSALPYVIRHDGQVTQSPIKNVEDWLADEDRSTEPGQASTKSAKPKK